MAVVVAAAVAAIPGKVKGPAGAEELAALPAGVVVLRVAEVTEKMENILRKAAAYQRNPGDAEDALVIGRPQMQQSVSILLKNTKLEETPRSGAAVRRLKKVSEVATDGVGPLTADELERMASMYAAARDDLKIIFDGFTGDEQSEFKQIFRKLQENDRAFMSAGGQQVQ